MSEPITPADALFPEIKDLPGLPAPEPRQLLPAVYAAAGKRRPKITEAEEVELDRMGQQIIAMSAGMPDLELRKFTDVKARFVVEPLPAFHTNSHPYVMVIDLVDTKLYDPGAHAVSGSPFVEICGFQIFVTWDIRNSSATIGKPIVSLAETVELANRALWTKQGGRSFKAPPAAPPRSRYQLDPFYVADTLISSLAYSPGSAPDQENGV